MFSPPGAAQQDKRMAPRLPPRPTTRPWWFPVQEVDDPLVVYLEAWLAEAIFGPERTLLPQMEWLSQALLKVDMVTYEDLAEISIFGRPSVQSRVKSFLTTLAMWHRELRYHRSKKMKRLEEFLKARAASRAAPPHPVKTA